ncbi:uncharacterized protein KQ657_002606 [Scheffersomyces spartinae]|uniref:RING-type domain-containing protein n=1 Tax=Scheffersomyces spartinae TaxID=45513 RepID=A0A9P7V6A5_9ASCO|nr:uncharacterized protein KQ657_002606 [Scheffersomyces spartinae]KAG7191999.1 hypothetical protein KQ657_002606 [Scheffersomyces spartinae]
MIEYYNSCVVDGKSGFNLRTAKDKPDIRNTKYKSPTDHLNCPICQQPFIEPMTTICGHTFCRECIMECFKMTSPGTNESSSSSRGSCPLDRTPIDSDNSNDLFHTPLVIANMVDDLQVHCLNMDRGCVWIGARWELEHHAMVDCGYTGVVCNGVRLENRHEEQKEPHDENAGRDDAKDDDVSGEDEQIEQELSDSEIQDEIQVMTEELSQSSLETPPSKCSLLVERRFIQDNEQCCHELFPCQYCEEPICHAIEETHLGSHCRLNYQTCDICENDTILQMNMATHKANCCHIRSFKCPANAIGCKWIGNNQTSLDIHMESDCPLNMFLPIYQNLSSKIETLESDNQFLQRQINRILNLVIQGKVTNLGYSDHIEEINKFETSFEQNKMVHLNFEVERMKFELEEKVLPLIDKLRGSHERENMLNNIISDNFMMKEDLNVQRMYINSLRKQLQFLLFARNRMLTQQPMEFDPSDHLDYSSSEERLNLKL